MISRLYMTYRMSIDSTSEIPKKPRSKPEKGPGRVFQSALTRPRPTSVYVFGVTQGETRV